MTQTITPVAPITPTTSTTANNSTVAIPNTNIAQSNQQSSNQSQLQAINNPTSSIPTAVNGVSNSVSSTPPTIPASTVNGTTPVTVPTTNPSTTQPNSDLVGVNGPQRPTVDSSGNPITYDANGNPIATASNANDLLTSAMGAASNEGQVATNLDTQYGLDAKTQAVADDQTAANNAYAAYQQAQAQQAQQITALQTNNPGGEGSSAVQGQIAQIQLKNSTTLANLALVANVAQNKVTGDNASLTAAQTIIQNKLNNQFAPITAQIGYLQNYIAANKDNLTTSQNDELQASLTDATGDYAAMRTQAQTAYATLQQYGALTLPNIQAIDAATTPAEIQAAVGNAINPGSSTSSDSTASTGSSPVSNYNLSSYSTDHTYTQQLTNASSTIGDVSLPSQASSVITAAAPNSPINGSMLVATATAAGVDPNVLASQLQVESNYGTKGAAVANNNPGNLKFAGQTGATQGSKATDGGYFAKFPTVQAGLTAEANQLAIDKNKAPVTTTPTNPYQTSGYTQAQYNTIKTNAPLLVQKAINFIPSTGDVYIDGSMLDSSNSAQASLYAKNNGNIPILTGSQVSDVQSADKALTQLNNIETGFTGLAPTSLTGTFGTQITNTFNSMAQTGTGNKINAYNDSTLPSALAILSGITGSSRVSAITSGITSKSLPELGRLGLPGSGAGNGDTLASGLAKINTIRQSLNSIITSVLPNSNGATLTKTPSSSSIPSGADGTQYGFPGYVSDGTQWVLAPTGQ